MRQLKSTKIIIVAKSTKADRQMVILPVTLNLSIGLFVWFVALALAGFTVFDSTAGRVWRWLASEYRGWRNDLPFIWLAAKMTFGGAYGLGA